MPLTYKLYIAVCVFKNRRLNQMSMTKVLKYNVSFNTIKHTKEWLESAILEDTYPYVWGCVSEGGHVVKNACCTWCKHTVSPLDAQSKTN